MRIVRAVRLTPDEIKLACIMYVRESAAAETGKMLEGLRDPKAVHMQPHLDFDQSDEQLEGITLTLPEINVSSLEDEIHG